MTILILINFFYNIKIKNIEDFTSIIGHSELSNSELHYILEKKSNYIIKKLNFINS